MSKKKKRRKVMFITLSPTKIEVTGFNGLVAMVRGLHEAMVADILRAVKVKVAPIGTVLTMK
jgi:hypothetical protein